MKKLLLSIAALASFAASANELIVTANVDRASTTGAIDIMASGDAVGYQANIVVGEGQQVNLSACSASARDGLQVQCTYAKGQVIVLLYFGDFRVIPAGRLNLGSFVTNAAVSNVSVKHFYAVDRAGVELNATSRVVNGASGPADPGLPTGKG